MMQYQRQVKSRGNSEGSVSQVPGIGSYVCSFKFLAGLVYYRIELSLILESIGKREINEKIYRREHHSIIPRQKRSNHPLRDWLLRNESAHSMWLRYKMYVSGPGVYVETAAV